MLTRSILRKIIIGISAISLLASPITSLAGGNGQRAQLEQIQALLMQVLSALSVTPPVAQNKTRLLFPFASNVAGFDTAIVISNTGLDSTGTIGIKGKATLNFFGANAPTPLTSPDIDVGGQYTVLVSTSAPNFQGYIEVVCEFPFAHGWGFLSDVGARNLAATIPALVLPLERTNTATEAVGQ